MGGRNEPCHRASVTRRSTVIAHGSWEATVSVCRCLCVKLLSVYRSDTERVPAL